jgi:putative addiction module killer protein
MPSWWREFGLYPTSPLGYNLMVEVRRTEAYNSWFAGLRDRVAKAKITSRIRRLGEGNPGDVRPVGHGISEMRIQQGPGYRVDFVQRGDVLVILLCGGDKSTQDKDIRKAQDLADKLPD